MPSSMGITDFYFYAGEPLREYNFLNFTFSVFFYDISETELRLVYPGGSAVFDKNDFILNETVEKINDLTLDILDRQPWREKQFISFCFISIKDEFYEYDSWRDLFWDGFLRNMDDGNPNSHVYFYRFDRFYYKLQNPRFNHNIPELIVKGLVNRSEKLKLPDESDPFIDKLLSEMLVNDAKKKKELFGSANTSSLIVNLNDALEKRRSTADLKYFKIFLFRLYHQRYEEELAEGIFVPESKTMEPFKEWQVIFRGRVKVFAKPYLLTRIEQGDSLDKHRSLLLIIALYLHLNDRDTKILFSLGYLDYNPYDDGQVLLMFLIDNQIYLEDKQMYKLLDHLGYDDLNDALRNMCEEFRKKRSTKKKSGTKSGVSDKKKAKSTKNKKIR